MVSSRGLAAAGVQPDEVTCTAAITASWEVALGVWHQLRAAALRRSAVTGNSLLNVLPGWEQAVATLWALEEMDVVSYNTAIKLCGATWEVALALLQAHGGEWGFRGSPLKWIEDEDHPLYHKPCRPLSANV